MNHFLFSLTDQTKDENTLFGNSFHALKNLAKSLITQNDNVPVKKDEFDFSIYSAQFKKGNLSYAGVHVTLYEDSAKCSLQTLGKCKIRVNGEYTVWKNEKFALNQTLVLENSL